MSSMKPAAPQTLFLILSLSIFYFLFSNTITAQDIPENPIGLSAIPPKLEVTVNPGETIVKEIKVRNDSAREQIVSVTSKDFVVTDDAGTPVQLELDDIPASQNRWAASSWIQISPANLRLKPGQTQEVTVTITVPRNALPGGHYAMILNSPDVEAIINQSGSTIQTNVGNLVYITVPGDVTQNAKIKLFSAPKFSEAGPITLNATITNLSDIHIEPVGAVNITNWLGGKTARLNLTANKIFPYTSRDFTQVLDKRFLFGRYKAQMIAAYGTTGSALIATIFFWVIPWRLILSLLFALTSLGLIVYLSRKKDQLTVTSSQVDDLERELEALKKKYQDRKK